MTLLTTSRRGLLLLGAALTLSACASTMPALAPAAAAPTPETLTDDQIMSAVNAVRKANGATPRSYSPLLENAARSRARLMAQRDTLSHDLGVTLRERVTAAGYIGAVGGEPGPWPHLARSGPPRLDELRRPSRHPAQPQIHRIRPCRHPHLSRPPLLGPDRRRQF
ncbi:CAP domain-containing protein [Devosia sp. A8/3-2]|nr:CAP domain-containing protein [Devosia sp. A8/3-2]